MFDDTKAPVDRACAIAAEFDCITEDDFCLLALIEPNTAASWRKRGKGPAYILFGNRYLYPRTAISEYFLEKVHKRRGDIGKGAI